MTRICFLLLILTAAVANAEIPAERYGQITLDAMPANGLLVNTFSDRTLVFDADRQQILGMLSLGIGANAVEVDREQGRIHVAENYFSRHTRGTRTDVITSYDIATLAPVAEIEIPPKHASGSPLRHYSGVLKSGDSRLMLVMNITPAVSVSVADLKSGRFLGEISTAGCGMIYPVDGLVFQQLCGDGSLQQVTLDADGREIARTRSAGFFDLEADPVMEKAVRTPGGWLFNTYSGQFYLASPQQETPGVEAAFRINETEGTENWRPGGMQPLAYYEPGDLLLALMHEQDPALHPDTHKDPGTEIWIYDVSNRRLKHRLALIRPASAIQVSQGERPLLYAASVVDDTVDIYDLKMTRLLGTLDELGMPTLLQNL